MDRLEGLHRDLCDTLMGKLERMRRADHDGLQALSEHERSLLVRIHEQEGLRKQVVERVGRGYGIAAETSRTMPARQLAQRVGDPYAERIAGAADRLKAVAEDVKRLNGLITRVSQHVLDHLREAFAAVSGGGRPAGVYSSAGTMIENRPRELFETVG
jgi:hypothetical protein